jgi:hypothetical protein
MLIYKLFSVAAVAVLLYISVMSVKNQEIIAMVTVDLHYHPF